MRPLLSLLSLKKRREQEQKGTSFEYISSQMGEQPLTSIQSRFYCRYGYGRAAESISVGESGQDFAAVRINDGSCSFVVCDGVGMSYRGDFAARFLGSSLLDWMERESDITPARFKSYLKSLAAEAASELAAESLSHVSEMLRNVLEDKRKQGSQSMYICGKIELPARSGKKGRMILAWQGDSRLRLWQGDQELEHMFRGSFQTGERWSSARGPVGGEPHWQEFKLSAKDSIRLQMYTDGLSDLDAIRDWLPDDQIQVLLDARHTNGLDDDAAYIELGWQGTS